VYWGSDLLEVRHLQRGQAFRVGEHALAAIDFIAPEEKLGGPAFTLLAPDSRQWRVQVPGRALVTGAEALDGEIVLLPGQEVRLSFGDLAFEFCLVQPGRRAPRALFSSEDRSTPLYLGLTALSMGALALGLAMSTPPFDLLDDEGMQRERLVAIQQILHADAERERPPQPSTEPSHGPSGEETAAALRGESGKLGKLTKAANNGRIAFRGQADQVTLSREEALAQAHTYGMIGLLSTLNAGHPLHAPWGAQPQGTDALDAVGDLWGRDLGDAPGSGGLGVTGTGSGAGGNAVGSIGVALDGACPGGVCSGLQHGFGRSHARGSRAHATGVPRVRMGVTELNGTLAPEVVQRIVRQNFGRFRMCYEQGLQNNPNLTGRVSVRFVIDRTGAVSSAANGGSDLPDSDVVACVVRAYYGLSFPSPENGIVTVRYPIMFSPG
jgi:hypothetical protein